MAERERLQKLMSQAGIASRRDAEAYIIAGRVMINGQVARLGDRADLSVDDVRIDGEPLRKQTHFDYIIVNKPMQVVTAVTRQTQEKRQTVRDLIDFPGRLFPVGRLDADSEGLVLMTNDGDLAERMTHPRYEHAKVYDVLVRGDVTAEQLAMWQRGVVLDDGQTLPAEVRVTEREASTTRLRITMREGRKRQIRRIALMLGHPVIRLLRTQIGPILLGNLQPGQWRELNKDEIDALKREAGDSVRRVRRRSRTPFRPNTTGPSHSANPTNSKSRSAPARPASPAPRREPAPTDSHSPAPGGHYSNPARPSRLKKSTAVSYDKREDETTTPERGPFKRPVAPPSRAKSKPPARHPDAAGSKRSSPSGSHRPKAAAPSDATNEAGSASPKPRKRPESANRSQKPNKGSRSGSRPRPSNSTARSKPKSGGKPGKSPKPEKDDSDT